MATFHLRILATITVPDTAVENESGRGWTLEDGTIIKPFVTLEANDDHDLDFDKACEIGLWIDNDEITSVTKIDDND